MTPTKESIMAFFDTKWSDYCKEHPQAMWSEEIKEAFRFAFLAGMDVIIKSYEQ